MQGGPHLVEVSDQDRMHSAVRNFALNVLLDGDDARTLHVRGAWMVSQDRDLEVELAQKPLGVLVDGILCPFHLEAPERRRGSSSFLLQGTTQFLHLLLLPEPGCRHLCLELLQPLKRFRAHLPYRGS